MRSVWVGLVLVASLGCAQRVAWSELSIREIEESSFDDGYRFWRQEKRAFATEGSIEGSHSTPAGATDSRTGEFTPSKIAALECRLGREAHLHQGFLQEQLATDPEVHRILEASARLCEEYGTASKAQVVRLADGRYSHRVTDGWSPQVQQRLWLETLTVASSQRLGTATESQSVHSGTGRATSAAGSRR